MRHPTSDDCLRQLMTRFPGCVHLGQSMREIHGRDEGSATAPPPDGVFVPLSAKDLASGLAVCHDLGTPVVPYGIGSGQEGGVLAVDGGVSISTAALKQILDIDADAMDCHVEAGVSRLELNAALRGTGLTFPVDPGADASLGGMAATGASGTMAPLYGSMLENTLGLEVALADGRLISTGTRARKSSAGYHLTKLFIASEGTLGVITKLRLRLHPLPVETRTLTCSFRTLPDAIDAVSQAIYHGLPIARAELMDKVLMCGVAQMTGRKDRGLHWMGFELHAKGGDLRQAGEILAELCVDNGGGDLHHPQTTEEICAVWSVRHNAAEAERHLKPGADAIVTDISVPPSKIPALTEAAGQKLEAQGLLAPLCGHLADGNLHYVILVDPLDLGERNRAMRFKSWLSEQALAVGGTISGEHGIGVGKRELMRPAHGDALDIMTTIKQALDPKGILNPGKIFSDTDTDETRWRPLE
ncbi:MAG: FAD-linked oxidase C-terminal domain-containing protein [Pseudomonadota bacterium]